MIIDLDRMGGGEGASVFDRELRPRGMGDGDESAGIPRSGRQPRRFLVRLGWGKIEGEPGRDYVPVFTGRGPHGVNLGADQCREFIGAQFAGVGDRPIEAAEKMIG